MSKAPKPVFCCVLLLVVVAATAGCGQSPSRDGGHPKTNASSDARAASPKLSGSPVGEVRRGSFGEKSVTRPAPPQPVSKAVMTEAREKHVQRRAAETARTPRSHAAAYRKAQLEALTGFCKSAPPDPRCLGTRVNERVAFPELDD